MLFLYIHIQLESVKIVKEVKILKEDHFIKINSTKWKELEDYSNKVNKKGVKALPSSDIKKFLELFRQCSHNLAYARTHYPESNTVIYLNSLVGKCHSHIYAVDKTSFKDILSYICYGFPKKLKEERLYIIISFLFFLAGALISLGLVIYNTDNSLIFLPQNMVEGVKSGQAGSGGQWNYPLVSSQIMVNNITVSLKAFALGITLGLGTIYVLFFNGATLGSLTALIYMYGSPKNYWSLILPHGVFELTAIFISGAAGLMIAKSLIIPGEYSRKHALIFGAKRAVSLIAGVVIMLVIAGIIEGFFTPLDISANIKLLFAAITAIILIVYFSIPYFIKK